MQRLLRAVVICLTLLGYNSIVTGETLYVPSEYATIQAAIDAASPGDVVEIADGTYTGAGNKNLDFGGKAITVRSASGDPHRCIIDCGHSGRGFIFQSGEDPNSIVSGLTIYNGYSHNLSPAASGAGVFCFDSSPAFYNCVIRGCSSNVDGGGVYCYYSAAQFTDCMIIGNKAHGYGGGVFCFRSSPRFSNCSIVWNSTHTEGGGVCVIGSSPTFINCRISGNTGDSGGGINCLAASASFSNCLISDNEASRGGGIFSLDCSIGLSNCTIAGNMGQGGGLFINGFDFRLTNCIVWDNDSEAIYVQAGFPRITFSNIQDGGGESWFGEGCIDADPLFVDPDGLDDNPWHPWDNNYRLAEGSPCIDAGTHTPPWRVPADDLDGNLRPFDGDGDAIAIVDMGAYELVRFGDINQDGFVDYQDYYALEVCLTGPFVPIATESDPIELNADAGSNPFDYSLMQLSPSGNDDIVESEASMTGPPIKFPPVCEHVDLDGDGDVDLADLAILYYRVTG